MTAPRLAACRCAHPKSDHDQEGFAPQCTAAGCTCLRYRPITAVPETAAAGAPRTPLPPAPAAAPTRPTAVPVMPEPGPDKPVKLTVLEVLRRGRESELKPINKLTARIDAQLEDLRERVIAEIHATDLKKAIADLEAQLASAKGELQTVARGRRTPPASKTSAGGTHACPDCAQTFSTPQGVGPHRAKKHGYRTAKAG